jgi:ankyrin repeat protein
VPELFASDYSYLWELLKGGDTALLEEVAAILDDFPEGGDDAQRRWIVNALHGGALQSIQWLLSKNVQLDFRNNESGTVLICAIERTHADRYEVLELLLQHGAPIHLQGWNDWTPAHMAVARNDVAALKLLVH